MWESEHILPDGPPETAYRRPVKLDLFMEFLLDRASLAPNPMGNTTQNLRRNIPFTGLGFEGLRRITEEPLGTHATKFGEPGCRALRTFRCGRTTTRGGNLLCALVSLPGASGQLRATICLNKKIKETLMKNLKKSKLCLMVAI